jgi:bacterioferritin (cytochrome b1)
MHDDHGRPSHGHGHHREHGAGEDAGKIPSILEYMLEHNRSHAGELAELARKLRHAGNSASAELIGKGVKDFEAGNSRLEEALTLLKTGNA